MSPTLPPEFAVALELLGSLNAPINPPLFSSIRFAAYAGTLTILRNEKEDAIGFVCWAAGNKESVRIADQFNLFPTRLWEFKEGKIAMLLFVYFLYPFNEQAKKAFRGFLADHRAVYYAKKDKKRLIVRTSNGFKAARLVKRPA